MSATYIPIQSTTLTTSTASVTFSNIPQTYTDLVLRCSTRNDVAAESATLIFNFNNDSSTIYSFTRLRGSGSAASSANSILGTRANGGIINGNTSTSNTFSSTELYLPNYTVSQNKQVAVFTAQENNNTAAFLDNLANLYSATTAITRIDIACISGNFLSGSTFHLYGISNA